MGVDLALTGVAIALALMSAVAGVSLGRKLERAQRPRVAPVEPGTVTPQQELDTPELPANGSLYPVRLLAEALRDPLLHLRRAHEITPELVAQFERIAWQARMLVSKPRPMQSLPTAPIGLLQEAAEQVEALRLGKVHASWTLLTRQPVHVDPDRTRGAFRELLASGTEAAGPAGRLGIRIVPGPRDGYPVQVEIEIGRRGVEVDSLSALVARHLLETQGARVEIDGRIVRVHLRSLSV